VNDTTGRWLDEQVAVIAQIAFDKRDINAEAIYAARRLRRPLP
jgi:hypothetical protein